MVQPKRKVRLARDERIREMVKEGYTYQEIANTYKISRQRAHQIANFGLSTPLLESLDNELTGE